MKDYKIKEAICNQKQAIDNLGDKLSQLTLQFTELVVRFEIMVEILQERENCNNGDCGEEKEQAQVQEVPASV